MARIPDEEVTQLKRDVSLKELAERHGIALTVRGDELVGLCPFHSEETPSLNISPSRNVFHCFGCGASGSVIDWVMKTRDVSFRRAVEILREGDAKEAQLPCPFTIDGSDELLLDEVTAYYHQELLKSAHAKAYLEKRGLLSDELIEKFRLGYACRTIGYRMPAQTTARGAAFKDRLIKLGVFRKSGHEHFTGSLVIPILDENGHTVQLYGRKTQNQSRAGAPEHLYLPGSHRGVFNVAGVKGQKDIILCEALIDALTFIHHGFPNTTTAYGVEGCTPEILRFILENGTARVFIAFDRDGPGHAGAQKVSEYLIENGVECLRVEFPWNMDANDFALKVKPPHESLKLLIKSAQWLGGKAQKQPILDEKPVVPPPPPPTAPVDNSPPAPVRADNHPPQKPTPTLSLPPAPRAGVPGTRVEKHAHDDFTVHVGDRAYRIRGLMRNASSIAMKVNVSLRVNTAQYVDTFDAASGKARAYFCKSASMELSISEDSLKKDLGLLVMVLQDLLDAHVQAALEKKNAGEKKVEISDEDRAAAMQLLRDARLLEAILDDFEQCGIVGEEVNKLTGYVAATSRLLKRPLAVVIQSSSAAGKSSLMDAVLAMMPEELVQRYSAMTGQSLYYMGDKDMRHKILALAEEEGAERATYALKLLQSEGQLSIASTAKDPVTGQLSTRDYRVEGPVMIFLTTTSVLLDEELENRCVKLGVDESREQTRAIHRLQRQRRTLEGIQAEEERDELLKLHHNAQRLLERLPVYNPFTRELTFPDDQTRTRRDNEKYLSLIDAIALLHQHQRPRRKIVVRGEELECIEVSLHDVAVANMLAHRVLGKSLDHLPPQTRRLLGLMTDMVKRMAEATRVEPKDVRFSRRALREFTGWSLTQVRVHLDRLVEEEYVLAYRQSAGQLFTYELLYDGNGDIAAPYLRGLIDVDAEAQRSGTTVTWRGVAGRCWADGGPKTGGSKDHSNAISSWNGAEISLARVDNRVNGSSSHAAIESYVLRDAG